MTTVFNDISAALDSHMNDLGFNVAWDNFAFDPSKYDKYVRATIIPALTEQAGVSNADKDRHEGIYQITIYSKANTGKFDATLMADSVADHFKRGTTLSFNAVNVKIRNIERSQGFRENDFFSVVLSIYYKTFTNAR